MLNVTWQERAEITLRFIATLALGFALAWLWQGNKIGELRKDAVDHENNMLRDKDKQIEALQKERDSWQDKVHLADTTHTKELNDAHAETAKLARCIADGTCGLRVKATCPAQHPAVSTSTANPAGVDDAGTATLTPTAQQDYYALRDAIAVTEGQLRMCQDYVRSITQ